MKGSVLFFLLDFKPPESMEFLIAIDSQGPTEAIVAT